MFIYSRKVRKCKNIKTLTKKQSSNSLEQWFLNFNVHQHLLEGLLKPGLLDPTLEFLIQ